jgi:sulfite reductase (NADPH) hemoprotein beta-component
LRAMVEAEFEAMDAPSFAPSAEEIARIEAYFAPPAFAAVEGADAALDAAKAADPRFAAWIDTNVVDHREPGYAIATISLKAIGEAPGDATSDQMRVMADLAERYSFDELRVTHEQNIVLPHLRKDQLHEVYQALDAAGLGTANIGLISDMIACPGLDYCALATARSIPIAQDIARHFADPVVARDLGELKIKISGCINACGHHHVGHIGILGLDKGGIENYQITIGGDATETAAIGERMGPGFPAEEVVPAIERIVETYKAERLNREETFLQTYRRIGAQPFKDALYPSEERHAA